MGNIKSSINKAVIAYSKNTCAYPGCKNKIISRDGKMLGNVCHIEAREKGGPRYNEKQTDKERNGFDNLICLCYEHHQITHDLSYSVEDLKRMKYDAENSINNDINYINASYIYEIARKQNEYKNDINSKYLESKIPEDIKVPFNAYADFKKIMADIYECLKILENIHIEITKEIDNLNNNIINHLKKLEYDSSKWEKQFYSDNPFFNMLWEKIHLSLNNSTTLITIRLIQLEYLYYEEYLKINQNDSIAKIEFNKVKEKLENITGLDSLYD